MLEQLAPQGRKHRGIFELYVPPGAGEKCPACRRPFAPLERKILHNDVELCSGCASKFLVEKCIDDIRAIRRQLVDLDYRAGV